MLCQCFPPKTAILRTSTSKGERYGQKYFNCPDKENPCKLFYWVGSPMPISLTANEKASSNYNESVVSRKTVNSPHRNSTNDTLNPKIDSSSNHQLSRAGAYSTNFISESNSRSSNNICVRANIFSIDTDNGGDGHVDNSGTVLIPKYRVWYSLMSPFHLKLREFYVSLPHQLWKYHESHKMWIFDFETYEHVISTLSSTNFPIVVSIEELPVFLVKGVKTFLNQMKKFRGECLETEVDIHHSLRAILKPFQLEGIKFVVSRGGRAMIADEMGVGKTIQAIGVLQHYRRHWPALILVPPNLVQQWESELRNFMPQEWLADKDLFVWAARKNSSAVKGKVCIVPYSMVSSLIDKELIDPAQFGVVIADESHNMKTMDSKRTTVCLPFLRNAQIALCLSGTPVLNRPVEIFSQLEGLLPTVFTPLSFNGFTKRYCDAKPHRFRPGDDVSGLSNEAELRVLLEGLVMIRRLKENVLRELPEKRRIKIDVEPDEDKVPQLKAIRKRMDEVQAQLKNEYLEDSIKKQKRTEEQVLINQYCQVTGTAKINSIRKELLQLIETASIERFLAESADDDRRLKQDMLEADAAQLESQVLPHSDDKATSSFQHRITELDHKKAAYSSEVVATGKIMELEEDILMTEDPVSLPYEKKPSGLNDDEALVDSGDEGSHEKKSASSQQLQSARKRLRKGNEARAVPEVATTPRGRQAKSNANSNICDFFQNDDGCGVGGGGDDAIEVWDEGDDEQKAATSGSTYDHSDEEYDSHSDAPPKVKKAKKKATKKDTAAARKSKSKDGMPAIPSYRKLGRKILVFAHHHEVLDAIQAVLQENNVVHVRIDGKVTPTPKAKAALVKRFQEDDATVVALLSITACGTGLNLTRANVVLFAELTWSDGNMQQAEDRIHRIGQDSSQVRFIYICARNSSDEIVWEQLQKKRNVVNSTIGVSENLKAHKTSSDTDTKQPTMESYMNPAPPPSSSAIATSSSVGVSPGKGVSSPQKRNQHQSDIPSYYLKLLSSSCESNNTTEPEQVNSSSSSVSVGSSISTTSTAVDLTHGSTISFLETNSNFNINQQQSKPNTFHDRTTTQGESKSKSIQNHSMNSYPSPYEMRPAADNTCATQTLSASSTSSAVNTAAIVDSSGLTQAQRERIERNRLAALQLRQKKLQEEEARLKGLVVPEKTSQFTEQSSVLGKGNGYGYGYERQPIPSISSAIPVDRPMGSNSAYKGSLARQIPSTVSDYGYSGGSVAHTSLPNPIQSVERPYHTFPTASGKNVVVTMPGNQPSTSSSIPSDRMTASDYGYSGSSISHPPKSPSPIQSTERPYHTFPTASGKNVVVSMPGNQPSHHDIPILHPSSQLQTTGGPLYSMAAPLATGSNQSGMHFPITFPNTRNSNGKTV